MSAIRPHAVGLAVLAAVAAVVLGIATTLLLAATDAFRGPAPGAWEVRGARCSGPAPAGQVVDVTAADMGPGMRGGPYGHGPSGAPGWHGMGMMRLFADRGTVAAGTVSLRVFNAGALRHEVVVLPLPAGQAPGQRPTGADGRVDEAGSLGEASHSCRAGAGDGITPGATGWTTLTLRPGHYELVCNFPGHYAAGMYTELNVTGR
jgi:uncharacterized cupredoxin-like copper-binding protein